jgi:hypothetical protein
VTTSKEFFARERLQWVENARVGILAAIDDVVHPKFEVFPTVDPLRFILKITLQCPLGKATREPMRSYLRAWAKEYHCDMPTINITDRWVQAEVLTQERKWSRDAKGHFKQDTKFEKKTR